MSTRIVQGNLQPYFYFTIPGEDDLTGAVVTCTMLDIDDNVIIDASAIGCYITDVEARQAEYRWQEGNTDLSGTFSIYFTITPDVVGVDPFDTDAFPIEIIANGSDELVTIEDVERQIRFSLSNQSEDIIQLIQAVREQGESVTRRALKPTNKILTLDGFPSGRGIIEIPNAPLRSISSITYFDGSGVLQTIDPSLYKIGSGNNVFPQQLSRVMPVYGESWPSTLDDVDVVTINYVCGYGTVLNSESVYETIELPKAIKQWMLINIANLYNNPETIVVSNVNKQSLVQIPMIASSLIANYKIAGW